MFTILPQKYIHSLALCQNLSQRGPDNLYFLQNITLVHYIDDLMLTGATDKEGATTLCSGLSMHQGDKKWDWVSRK